MDRSVSIIVTAYNYGAYVSQAVESLINQEGDLSLEIIVVDDGSTDDTRSILESYGPSIKAIHQANSGVSMARNRGIEAASGNYIGFLDADDYYHSDKLIRQVCCLEKYPEIGWTYCDSILHDEDSAESLLFSERYEYRNRLALDGPSLFESLIPANFIPVYAPLIRRKYVESVGSFDKRFSGIEDFDYWLRLSAVATAKYLPEPLAGYRWHQNSLGRHLDRMSRDKYIILDQIGSLYSARIKQCGAQAKRAIADMHNYFANRHLENNEPYPALRRLRHSLSLCPLQGMASWNLLKALYRSATTRQIKGSMS